MATARFQYGNPARPAGGAVPIRSAAWRLIGGNNRDLGCCPAEFDGSEASRQAVLELRARIADAVPMITIDPQTSEWTWRLELDGRVVARSVRGYLRHRECLYNVSHFLGSVPVAALPGEPADPAALLAAKAPAAAMAWMAAILAIEAARTESGRPSNVADEVARTRADAAAAAETTAAQAESDSAAEPTPTRTPAPASAADPAQPGNAPTPDRPVRRGHSTRSSHTSAAHNQPGQDQTGSSDQNGLPNLSGCWVAGRGRSRRRGLESGYAPLSFPGEAAFDTLETVPCDLAGGAV